MEAKELRQFSVEELRARVRQWRDELFRAKFKSQSSEAKDTSIFKKLRKDIARGETILTEKVKLGGAEVQAKAPAPTDQEPTKKAEKKPRKAAKSKGVASNDQ